MAAAHPPARPPTGPPTRPPRAPNCTTHLVAVGCSHKGPVPCQHHPPLLRPPLHHSSVSGVAGGLLHAVLQGLYNTCGRAEGAERARGEGGEGSCVGGRAGRPTDNQHGPALHACSQQGSWLEEASWHVARQPPPTARAIGGQPAVERKPYAHTQACAHTPAS